MEQGRPRRPTMVDVAREAGVSVATAGRSLGGYGYVSDSTRSRIEAAATKLGYSPNVIARSMRSGGTRTIGFVGSDIANPFFAEAMRGVCDVARQEGYEAILTNSDEQLELEQIAVNVLLDKQVDGMVVAPASVTDTLHLARARQQGVPVVLLDRYLPQVDCDSVVIDNETAACEAVEHLLGLGHRRIGLLASINPTEQPHLIALDGTHRLGVTGARRPSVERVRGYLRALAMHGATSSRRLMRYSPSGDRARADAEAEKLMAGARPPTAVFAADNVATRSAFVAAKRLKLRIPEDVSIVGFDDLEWTSMVEPPISVVAQSPLAMGRVAAERLFLRISGDERPSEQIVLPTELLVRESTVRHMRQRLDA